MTQAASSMEAGKQNHKIQKECELRLEAEGSGPVTITLLEGSAEVFGTELTLGKPVKIENQNIAVYTYQGCTVEVEGKPKIVYVAEDTNMHFFINLHHILEQQRKKAQESGAGGPHTMIVGPTDSGKSTLCKILLNYAVRYGWAPIFVDLDIGQGSITVPGTISATPIQDPIHIEHGYPLITPLVFYYGNLSGENPDLYRFLVQRMGSLLINRAQEAKEAAASGMFINTMGWIDGTGYNLLLNAIKALKVDVVLVMGHDRLYSQLEQELTQQINVVKIPRSGGVVQRERNYRRRARNKRIREYFYGIQKDLSPTIITIKFSEMGGLYRVGVPLKLPDSALPLGHQAQQEPLQVSQVRTLNRDIVNSLVAVSHAPTQEDLLSYNIAGFILVQEVDLEKGTITYLCPNRAPFPGKYFLVGQIREFQEEVDFQ
eukprot:TRINITY_DN30261_c0_g1_i2.p1 TRINITY_DN30261_c0_g1~~TRINITY_DN30261_c0_g1_i2.p1  ORF type:complete len:430 (+),score=60.49 TRINITY_DN30261_c0_g1_i2:113-1402(+)